MSSSYDESIFERDSVRFILSQRFKENYRKFYSTLKATIQMVLTSTILGQVSQPLCYALLFLYSFTLVTLFFLTAKGLWNQRKGNVDDDNDLDVVDVIISKPDYILRSIFIVLFLVAVVTFLFLLTSNLSFNEGVLQFLQILVSFAILYLLLSLFYYVRSS